MEVETMSRVASRVALLGCVGLVAACGGASGVADVRPEPMPAGETYTGVYESPQYGEMHLVQTGEGVIGEYTRDDRRGTLQGSRDGNLLRFRWKQVRELVRGRPTESEGRGYFQYVMGEDGRTYLVGRWGLGDNEVDGGPWRAYKLRNREPELTQLGTGGEAPAEDGEPASDPAATGD